MTLPIRLLPVEERWGCHCCGICCRGVVIPLDHGELQRLRQQKWHEHPEFRGKRLIVRLGFLRPFYRLAHRKDGYCVFFTAEGRCRIHEVFGEAAKPVVCRMFPYQLVALEHFAYLTVRRDCPSAAVGRGRPLAEQEGAWRPLAEASRLAPLPEPPPPITADFRGPWKLVLRVTDALERLLCDARFPLVRRLVHGLKFCELLSQCRLGKLDEHQFAELVTMLEGSSPAEAAEVFRKREPPSRTGALLFRRTVGDYLRLHPKFVVENTWPARVRWARTVLMLALGRGRLSHVSPLFPDTTFTGLERPLGHLGEDVLRPLNDYFQSMAISKRYAVCGRPGWPLVDRFRAMAASYPVAMWFLRLTSAGRQPTAEDAVDAVITIDRGESYSALFARAHRQRLAALVRLKQFERLVAWHAR